MRRQGVRSPLGMCDWVPALLSDAGSASRVHAAGYHVGYLDADHGRAAATFFAKAGSERTWRWGGMSCSKQFHSAEGIAAPVGNGYTHAITAGGAICVSGQIGMDPSGTIPEGFEAQARRAFENLDAVLAAAGASLSDIVKVTVLLVGLSDLAAYRSVRETYLPHLPASTLCVVKSLAMPELLFEIEAIAVRD